MPIGIPGRVIIEADRISVEGFDMPDYQITRGDSTLFGHTCRTHAQEVIAWAIGRAADELRKSIEFHHTGEATDRISVP